jgi:hypothetical protein
MDKVGKYVEEDAVIFQARAPTPRSLPHPRTAAWRDRLG